MLKIGLNLVAIILNVNRKRSTLWDVVNSFRQSKNAVNEAKRIKQLILENNIKTAFIFMRLAHEYTGKEIYYNKNEREQKYVYIPNPQLPQKEAFLQSLRDTVSLCTQNGVKNIYIQMPIPEPKKNIPNYVFFSHLFHPLSEDDFNKKFNESLAEYETRTKELNALLQEIEKEFPEVTLISPVPAFLNKKTNYFFAIENNISYYYDDDHLSNEGAALLYPFYEEAFKKMKDNNKTKE